MQHTASKIAMVVLSITGQVIASPPPHVAVSVQGNGIPEVLNEIKVEIADADRFTNEREAQWLHHLDGIQEARDQVHEAIAHIKAKNESSAELLHEIQEAKEKLQAEERSMFSVQKKEGVLSDHVMHNLDSHLDEARQQIQDARAKLHSEPLIKLFEFDEEEQSEEARASIDDLLSTPSDLLPSPQDEEKKEALQTVDQLLNSPSEQISEKAVEEMEPEDLVRLEESLLGDLTQTISEVDHFTQKFEKQLQSRLEGIKEARSKIQKSMDIVNELKDGIGPITKPQWTALEEIKQAKAKLISEEKAMFSMVPHQGQVLSDNVMNNLDDNLAEARQQIAAARAKLAAEPALFSGKGDGKRKYAKHLPQKSKGNFMEKKGKGKGKWKGKRNGKGEGKGKAKGRKEIKAVEDHEQALEDIRRDVQKVRAAIAKEEEESSVVQGHEQALNDIRRDVQRAREVLAKQEESSVVRAQFVI